MAIMTGREALMQLLHKEGVEYIFGLPGTTELLFLDALEDHPEIKYILTLHEAVALGMAEGYARTSGKVGVINLHTCAGLAAAMPMLLNAHLGGVPLLVTAGKQDTRLLMQEPHLAGDLVGMASHLTKWSTEISYAEDIPVAIRRALKVAMQPPTGPVFVSLPVDVMDNSLDFEYVPGAPSFTRLRPDQKAIAIAVKYLANARRPAIIVESGVTRNNALSEVVELAELIGARVYQAWVADVNFPNNHPQYMGDLAVGSLSTREMFESVDVLVVVGATLFAQPFYLPKPLLTEKTKVIQIDDNAWEIAKNIPVVAGIAGHIKVSLAELNDSLHNKMTKATRERVKARVAEMAGEKKAASDAFLEKVRQEKDQVPISVSRLMQELRDSLKPGTILVDEAVSCSATLRRIIDFTEPMSFLSSRGGGSIGWGMPGALGVKLAAPDRPVVAVSGDGSAIWSIQSLWTAAHYNLPVTLIICANAGYTQLKMSKRRILGEKAKGRHLGLDFAEPRIDFCQMAQAMGVPGQKVERPEDLRDVLKKALESGKPNVVEVSIASG